MNNITISDSCLTAAAKTNIDDMWWINSAATVTGTQNTIQGTLDITEIKALQERVYNMEERIAELETFITELMYYIKGHI